MRTPTFVTFAFAAIVAGCASTPPPRSTVSSQQTVRLTLPPDEAAACFARNAEEHSGALIAEVSRGGDRANVVVRVRNGVLYAAADFRRAGSGSTAALTLNVTTNSRRSDLVDSLFEGC